MSLRSAPSEGLELSIRRLRDEIKAGKKTGPRILAANEGIIDCAKKPSPTTSPLSLETMSDARGLHSTTSGGNSFTSINMSEFPTYSRSTPQPPAPPRWQESEPKPERSSRKMCRLHRHRKESARRPPCSAPDRNGCREGKKNRPSAGKT